MKKRSQIEILSTQYSEFSNGSRAYDPLEHQLDEIVRTPQNRSEDIHRHFTPCKLVTLTWQPSLGKLPAFPHFSVLLLQKKHENILQIIFRNVNINLIA